MGHASELPHVRRDRDEPVSLCSPIIYAGANNQSLTGMELTRTALHYVGAFGGDPRSNLKLAIHELHRAQDAPAERRVELMARWAETWGEAALRALDRRPVQGAA